MRIRSTPSGWLLPLLRSTATTVVGPPTSTLEHLHARTDMAYVTQQYLTSSTQFLPSGVHCPTNNDSSPSAEARYVLTIPVSVVVSISLLPCPCPSIIIIRSEISSISCLYPRLVLSPLRFSRSKQFSAPDRKEHRYGRNGKRTGKQNLCSIALIHQVVFLVESYREARI
jgi:hypothetical protein